MAETALAGLSPLSASVQTAEKFNRHMDKVSINWHAALPETVQQEVEVGSNS